MAQVHANLMPSASTNADGDQARRALILWCATVDMHLDHDLRLGGFAAVSNTSPLCRLRRHVHTCGNPAECWRCHTMAQHCVLASQPLNVQLQPQAIVALKCGAPKHKTRAGYVEPVQKAIAPLSIPDQRKLRVRKNCLHV